MADYTNQLHNDHVVRKLFSVYEHCEDCAEVLDREGLLSAARKLRAIGDGYYEAAATEQDNACAGVILNPPAVAYTNVVVRTKQRRNSAWLFIQLTDGSTYRLKTTVRDVGALKRIAAQLQRGAKYNLGRWEAVGSLHRRGLNLIHSVEEGVSRTLHVNSRTGEERWH